MAEFTLTCSLGGVKAAWIDSVHAYTRLNPRTGLPHLYWKIPLGTPAVRFSITLGASYEPLDAVLGGRTFLWWWAESPVPRLSIPTVALQSSAVLFGPELGAQAGHHLLVAWRQAGGSVGLPFIVE